MILGIAAGRGVHREQAILEAVEYGIGLILYRLEDIPANRVDDVLGVVRGL
jgi:hypothetical protein